MLHSLDLLSHLYQGAIVITPNHRLAQQLLAAYAIHYKPAHGGLPKPRCFAYQTFLQVLFKALQQKLAYVQHPVLLNSAQESHIWWTIVSQNYTEGLNPKLLDHIQKAWNDCHDWQLSINDKAFYSTTVTRRFQRWARLFFKALQSRHAISLTLVPAYLLEHPRIIDPCPMIWTCFNTFTPLQQRLQDHFAHQGHVQLYDDIVPKPIVGQYFAAQDETEEYQKMIAWAKQRLAAGVQTLAIVVPHLSDQAAKLRYLFAKNFNKQQYFMANIEPLKASPLIGAALQWIQLEATTLNHHQLRLLLQSPFIQGDHSDYILRSQILEKSNILQEEEISWELLLNILSQSAPSLYELLRHLNSYPGEDTPSAWAEHFKLRLARLGFPGETLSCALQQSFNRLMGLFDELMSLSFITSTITQHDAIKTLLRLAESAVLPIISEKKSIIIIDIQDAAGCTVDEMWVCGLNRDDLPARGSPFLPLALQSVVTQQVRDYPMQAAELEVRRLGYASQAIVYSYACLKDDMVQLPYAVITDYPTILTEQRAQAITPLGLIPVTEEYILPLQSKITGGTALLAAQAKCPFQAFASYRLQAKAPPSPCDGLNSIERGQIIHRLLEILWQQLQTQATLLHTTSEDLDAMIENAITTSLDCISQARPYSFPPLMQRVERKRLSQLVDRSLAFDKERPAFEVLALEANYTITLAGIDFKMRIDRIDRILSDGSKIVIDYKSSLPTRNPWQEKRPEAPQLLLYSLVDTDIKALLFMQLKAGKATVDGVSSLNIPGLHQILSAEEWDNTQAGWMRQLTTLAEEISKGHSAPQPSRPTHCLSCSVKTLCRFKP